MGRCLLTMCYFGFKDTEILSLTAQSYLCQYTIQLIIIAFHLISICKSLYKFYPNIFNSLGVLLVSAMPWGIRNTRQLFFYGN